IVKLVCYPVFKWKWGGDLRLNIKALLSSIISIGGSGAFLFPLYCADPKLTFKQIREIQRVFKARWKERQDNGKQRQGSHNDGVQAGMRQGLMVRYEAYNNRRWRDGIFYKIGGWLIARLLSIIWAGLKEEYLVFSGKLSSQQFVLDHE